MKKLLGLSVVLLSIIGTSAFAASATWVGPTGTQVWVTGSNWSPAAAPGAITGTTNSDVATFNAATSGTAVTIDSGRNIGGITFDTTSGAYTIGSAGANAGNSLLLSSGGTIQIASTFTGASTTETINAPLTLEGGYTFANNSTVSSNLLNFAGNITNAAGSTITLSGANTGSNTISGNILAGTGTLGILKSGAGTWVLAGANTYTGSTRVNAGTLQVTGSLVSNALTFGGPGNSGTLNFNEAAGASQSMGALSFSAGGEGTVISTYGGSGNTLLTFASLAARPATATGNFVVSGGTNGSTNKIVITGATVNTFFNQGIFFNGSNYAWYDASGYVRGINYGSDTNSESITASTGAFTSGKLYEQLNGSGAITSQGTQTITTLSIANSNGVALASGATLTVNGILKSGNTSGSVISGGTGIQANGATEMVIRADQSSDALNISSAVIGTGSLTKSGLGTVTLSGNDTYTGITTVDSGTLNLTGNNSGASAGLTVKNGATASVSGNNTYTAGTLTADSGGTLILSGDNTGTSGTFGVQLNSTGTLDINSAKALGNAALTIINGSGVLDNTSGGTVTVSTTNAMSIGSFIFGGTNDLNMGTGTVTIGSTHITASINAGTLTFGGSLPGTASTYITKAGAGTLALTGNVTYLGTTSIGTNNGVNAGTLLLSGDNSAATGGVLVWNGTLDINSAKALGGTLTFSNALAVIDNTSSSAVTLTTNPTQTWGTSFTFTGTKDLNLGTGAVALSTMTLTTTAGTLTEGGNITGTSAALTKAGAGTLVLSGTNTFNGGMTIAAGTVSVGSIGNTGSGGNLGNNNTINIGATTTGAILAYTGAGETSNRVINLAGTTGGATIDTTGATGGLVLSANLTATGAGAKTLTLTGNTAGNAINGVIRDNSVTNTTAVTKSGTGTWTLAAANTYTGGTIVSGGNLKVSNTTGSATGTSSVTVQNTATLSGGSTALNGGTLVTLGTLTHIPTLKVYASGATGLITGPVTIQNGAHLAPGNSVGTLTTANLTLNLGSVIDYEFNSTANDFTSVSATLTLNGGAFNLYQEGTTTAFAAAGTYDLLSYGVLAGTGIGSLSVANAQVGYSYTFVNDTADKLIQLQIAVVPEPSTWAMMIGGFGLLLFIQRSRRSRKSSL